MNLTAHINNAKLEAITSISSQRAEENGVKLGSTVYKMTAYTLSSMPRGYWPEGVSRKKKVDYVRYERLYYRPGIIVGLTPNGVVVLPINKNGETPKGPVIWKYGDFFTDDPKREIHRVEITFKDGTYGKYDIPGQFLVANKLLIRGDKRIEAMVASNA